LSRSRNAAHRAAIALRRQHGANAQRRHRLARSAALGVNQRRRGEMKIKRHGENNGIGG
jgi:hypothetical protein